MVKSKAKKPVEIIIDSRRSFREAIAGTVAPPEFIKELCLLTVQYYSFDRELHQGQLVVHRSLQKELAELFVIIRATRFPLARVIPIVQYGWSDEASMDDNNSSAFNYRFVTGTTRLSLHAYGLAIDINPQQNPVMYAVGASLPPGAAYDFFREGTFSPENRMVKEFLSRGWQWGGYFRDFKDYHHFEKSGRSGRASGNP